MQSGLLIEQTRRLKEQQEQTIQRERLSAVGQMAAGIAHDFNNALTPILGYSELLALNPEILKDQARSLRYMRTINTAASDAATVVGRLRDFYRPRDMNDGLEPLDLNAIVTQAALLTQPRWKDQSQMQGIAIDLRTELAPVPAVRGNGAELRDMLANLIFNAVDAMPKGGALTLRSRRQDYNVMLEIEDTGVGMSEDVRRRCLDPFFTTKGAKGTGLGLSMVYGTIKRHDGELSIASEPGRGTKIAIRLPACHDTATASVESAGLFATSSLRVLVVDDEPDVRDVVASFLTNDSNSVETAVNGREGFSKFRAGNFQLVILDRSMPELNGDQLAWEIKCASPGTPVIMLTGFGEFMRAKNEYPRGVDFVLSKPVRIDELRRAVSNVMAAEAAR